MSKRRPPAGAPSTKDKSETGSEKKRQRAEWPPSEPGEEFSYTFTGQESLGLSADDMLLIAGTEVKGICAKGQYGNVAKAIKNHHPHGVNEHNFHVSAVKYCVAHPLITAGGMQKFLSSGARPPTGVFAFVGNVMCLRFARKLRCWRILNNYSFCRCMARNSTLLIGTCRASMGRCSLGIARRRHLCRNFHCAHDEQHFAYCSHLSRDFGRAHDEQHFVC